ncbi:LacI family DNA-binding transcriptional regulator [Actinoplanes sp. ATCC 53533]|uniref:LacI family DNA-binding transcriptional regulator n=1 Tax=Actinoplanes sp. ATCC 53533 TaxID=1288362 RepID=UPI001F415984|nr:substrate-binding domain-containing protein [Actinoplanes sp. ATCC 53533]
MTRKRRYLVETVAAGPEADEQAEVVRARLLREVGERRELGFGDGAGSAVAAGRQAGGAVAAHAPERSGGAGPPAARRAGGLTIATIARLAGVSAPTVSKVLNGRSGVASETRRRVEGLLREQGYRRPEKVTRAALLEVAFYGLLAPAAVEVMRGVKRVAVEQGLAVGFTDVQQESSTGRDWAQDLLARRPTGVVAVHMGAMPEQHGLLNASGIPIVVVDPTSEPLEWVPSVSAANRRGGIVAARHLLDLGHRRIAVISGPPHQLCARARLDGVRSALEAAQAPLDESLVRPGMWFSFEDGFSHGRELLRLPEPPTAVLCGNDLQAFGVFEAARQSGLRIPQDLSVVGFDDISYARWSGPQLTTVHQPFGEMGATAAELVLALAAGETVRQSHVELAVQLVIRDSTAAPSR